MLLSRKIAPLKASGTTATPSSLASSIFTPASSSIKKTSARLALRDHVGDFLVRWDYRRNDYRVESGLYACGNPGRGSPVLVTANYRLTFNSLRKELSGLDVWILVLDTKGVNVWCSAGKGTFGTEELVRRIGETGLSRVIDHRELILPELAASGVAAHLVTRETGYRIRYGPVRAGDLGEYLSNGYDKSDEMRRVRFNLADRLAVAPVEIMHAKKFFIASLVISFLAALSIGRPDWVAFGRNLAFLSGGILAGTVVFAALLPVLPFRAFAAKGAVLGAAWCLASLTIATVGPIPLWALRMASLAKQPATIALILITVPLVSFLSMNQTGSSTFTCQSGAELEVRRGLPAMLITAAAGIALIVVELIRTYL